MIRVNDADTTWLTDEDYRAFMDALTNPAKPTSYLIKAVKDSKRRVISRDE